MTASKDTLAQPPEARYLDPLETTRLIADRLAFATELGLEVRCARDNRSTWGRAPEGVRWSPFFDPARNDLLRGDLLVVEGLSSSPSACTSETGTSVPGAPFGASLEFRVALRRVHLGRTSVSEYLDRALARYRLAPRVDGPAEAPLPDVAFGSDVDAMRGTLLLAGEDWISPGLRERLGERARGSAERRHPGAELVELGLLLGCLEWHPDWAIALMDEGAVRSGYHLRCGFGHAQPIDTRPIDARPAAAERAAAAAASSHSMPGHSIPSEPAAWLVSSSAEDIAWRVRAIARQLDARASTFPGSAAAANEACWSAPAGSAPGASPKAKEQLDA